MDGTTDVTFSSTALGVRHECDRLDLRQRDQGEQMGAQPIRVEADRDEEAQLPPALSVAHLVVGREGARH